MTITTEATADLERRVEQPEHELGQLQSFLRLMGYMMGETLEGNGMSLANGEVRVDG